jgi:hypothetical protein
MTRTLQLKVGTASECALGFHGQMEYKGKRLVGMWPHQQVVSGSWGDATSQPTRLAGLYAAEQARVPHSPAHRPREVVCSPPGDLNDDQELQHVKGLDPCNHRHGGLEYTRPASLPRRVHTSAG